MSAGERSMRTSINSPTSINVEIQSTGGENPQELGDIIAERIRESQESSHRDLMESLGVRSLNPASAPA
jgi:hypothetical protein